MAGRATIQINSLLFLSLFWGCGQRPGGIEVGSDTSVTSKSMTSGTAEPAGSCNTTDCPLSGGANGAASGGANGTSGTSGAASPATSWDSALTSAWANSSNLADLAANLRTNVEAGGESYELLSYQAGSKTDRPHARHADINIWLRGIVPAGIRGQAARKHQDGPEDQNAPRIYTLLDNGRDVALSSYKVYGWKWPSDSEQALKDDMGYKIHDGSRDGLIFGPNKDVTAVGFATQQGQSVKVPFRGPKITGDKVALVLYATPNQMTLKYTLEDNVVTGYTIHIIGVAVHAGLIQAYLDSVVPGDSGQRPALAAGAEIGKAMGSEVILMVRDVGSFMNPLDTNHWWD
jgi:hypothetical protein